MGRDFYIQVHGDIEGTANKESRANHSPVIKVLFNLLQESGGGHPATCRDNQNGHPSFDGIGKDLHSSNFCAGAGGLLREILGCQNPVGFAESF